MDVSIYAWDKRYTMSDGERNSNNAPHVAGRPIKQWQVVHGLNVVSWAIDRCFYPGGAHYVTPLRTFSKENTYDRP